MTRALTAVALTVIAACLTASALAETAWQESGVRGDVHTGPTCGPVSNPPRPECAPRPYETVIRIRKLPSGELVKKVKSGERGRFHAGLAPGRYRLRARGGKDGGLPRCFSKDVTVKAREFTRVHLSCDSGIR
jgi:hypothetical protein